MNLLHRAEDIEQRALFQWASMTRISGADTVAGANVADYLFAIPNGGYRSSREAAIMKGLGVKRGVSDVFLPLARQGKHGLWIELKRQMRDFRFECDAKRAVTDAQQMWIQRMMQAGYVASVCYGWESARTVIRSYLAIRA